MSDEEAAAALAAQLREQHPAGIDHAVSCFGSWWQKGHVSELPCALLRSAVL